MTQEPPPPRAQHIVIIFNPSRFSLPLTPLFAWRAATIKIRDDFEPCVNGLQWSLVQDSKPRTGALLAMVLVRIHRKHEVAPLESAHSWLSKIWYSNGI